MEQNKVAVIGAGLMGSGIAQTCAQAGYEVVNVDVFPGALEKAEDNLNTLFDKKVQKGKMTEEEKCEILGRISYSSTYEDVKGAFLIVEAVPEKVDIKKETFANLDQYADEETILVSNTSGLSISEIAAATKRAAQGNGRPFLLSGTCNEAGRAYPGGLPPPTTPTARCVNLQGA